MNYKFNIQHLEYICIFCISFIFIKFSFSQKVQLCKEFRKLSRPEKCWAFKHPYIAKKAFALTRSVRHTADSISKTATLDSDPDGGQVDAFRHSYWMALLSSRFNWRKAYKLGIAHEKGNYLDFKHKRYEEYSIPDKVSSDMDLCNNLKGIEIGLKFKQEIRNKKPEKLYLRQMVLDSILLGKMYIIRKNKKGDLLDKDNNLIPTDSLKEKWITPKSLVPSNFIRYE